ncbi:RluA family pseudouridine synthase [Nosocomiicoccus massiliensis]|uniref:RNA pseudouridylate synthase n=1 Tax=Nosocomiicoccus massiliensis TaxID=1232430 RepID=A0AAF0YK02_9STAP|nr:RNA pseudouridine synthase [Nosocomiicoccus massiliensis]WOS96941.1 RNA pseudouridine synthase [Nosocomiicoccus massiliensis]
MTLEILYEDNHVIAVTKPNNIPVQADDSNDKDMLTIVKEYIKEKYNKPGNVFLGLVHRLDRPVGGAIVFAKTSKGASRLSNEIRKQTFERKYLTVIEGHLNNSGTLEDYLVKNRKTNTSYVTSKDTKDAKRAVLDYKTIGVDEALSLLEVKLHTGRSHQIRVQLSNQNTPIFGDQRYNKLSKVGEQIALWSSEIKFKHPTKDEIITVTRQPPNRYPWNRFTN